MINTSQRAWITDAPMSIFEFQYHRDIWPILFADQLEVFEIKTVDVTWNENYLCF